MPTVNKWPVPFRTFLLGCSEAFIQTNHLKIAAAASDMRAPYSVEVCCGSFLPSEQKLCCLHIVLENTHPQISAAPQAGAQAVVAYEKLTLLFTGMFDSSEAKIRTFMNRPKCLQLGQNRKADFKIDSQKRQNGKTILDYLLVLNQVHKGTSYKTRPQQPPVAIPFPLFHLSVLFYGCCPTDTT